MFGFNNGIVTLLVTTTILCCYYNIDEFLSTDIVVNALVTPSSSTTVQPQQRLSLDRETIRRIQTETEDELRTVHDNDVFNALFLNVPDYPDPIPWTQRLPQTRLPSNFPPGCLLRLGPNGAPSHDGFMDGDGFVNCITFPPSTIQNSGNNDDKGDTTFMGGTFSSAYVHTRGRKLEESDPNQKKFLGTLGSIPYALPLLRSIIVNAINFRTLQSQKDTCNTALGIHDGRILALMEQCPPCELQVTRTGRVNTVADTVRLGNAIPWSPVSGGALSAHGRTCPITKERFHVSYDSNQAPYMRLDVFDTKFQCQRSIPVNVACPTMVHDCAITNQYVVILDFPLTLRTSRFLKNQFPVEYEPEYGARIGLLHRDAVDDSNIQWFECEPGIILHTINAFDDTEKNRVIVQALRSDPRGTKGYLEDFTTSFLYEYELDIQSGTVTSERYLNPYEPVEFPIINPNYVGQKSNTAVYCSSVRSIGGPLLHHKQPVSGITISGVTKFTLQCHSDDDNIQKGDVIDSFVFPLPWMVVSEPTVVPKTDGSGEYVLLIATKVVAVPKDTTETQSTVAERQSQVVVLDGDSLRDGPLWQCDLPHHVHYGLHSLFVEWESMIEDL
jgi:carotenoid cleavage dioxygenase-like enzyme